MLGIALVLGAGLGVVLGLLFAARVRRRVLEAAQGRAERVRLDARAEVERIRREAEVQLKEELRVLRAEAEAEISGFEEQLARRLEHVERRERVVGEQERKVQAAQATLEQRSRALEERQRATKAAQAEVRRLGEEAKAVLERQAGQTRDEVRKELVRTWVEEARSEAAARLRALDQAGQDQEYARQAKRVMGIAIGRYEGHYLTERLLATIALPQEVAAEILKNEGLLAEIERATGTKLLPTEANDGIRLEGGDGVGREIARRVVYRLLRTDGRAKQGTGGRDDGTVGSVVPPQKIVVRDPARLVQAVVQNIDREVLDLGKKAFAELRLSKAHPDIMRLVGRLNYRTSYTQNQWKHSVEAAFLAGLMANEMGFDPVLARRATLLHDVGKALTHELEGSHALIGADFVRNLGEDPLIANAIAAHHGEADPESPYASLVAAADALSGGRPGARREMVETYVQRITALERIAGGFRGVERAMAVQAGREVRVLVREHEVPDARVTTLASEIARRISSELSFPGQIKVTVIREFKAVETTT